jgi:hypothetical protein
MFCFLVTNPIFVIFHIMRENDLVGRSRTWTMLDDCALMEMISTEGTGKWGNKLQKLQNEKHVCVFATTTYESSKASGVRSNGKSPAEDKIRDRWKVLSGQSNKGKTASPYAADFPITAFVVTPQQAAHAASLVAEERDAYHSQLEMQHAADEGHCKAMWEWIRERANEARERELLGNTEDARPTSEEAQHRITAADEEHRAAHVARRAQNIEFAEEELKFRRVLTDNLSTHRQQAPLEARYMAASMVYFRHKCQAKYGVQAIDFDKEVAEMIQTTCSSIAPDAAVSPEQLNQ